MGQEERVFGDKLLGLHVEREGAGRVEGDSQAPVGEQVDRAAGGSRDGWVRSSFVGKCGFGVGHVGQGSAESAGDWVPSPGGQARVGVTWGLQATGESGTRSTRWGDGEGWGQERTLGTPAVSAPTVGPMRGDGRGKGVGLRPEGPLALPVEKLQCLGPESLGMSGHGGRMAGRGRGRAGAAKCLNAGTGEEGPEQDRWSPGC